MGWLVVLVGGFFPTPWLADWLVDCLVRRIVARLHACVHAFIQAGTQLPLGAGTMQLGLGPRSWMRGMGGGGVCPSDKLTAGITMKTPP